MFLSDKATACRSFISHSSRGRKITASILVGAALLVVVDVASRPAAGPSAVDVKEIKRMSARQMSNTPSGPKFFETGSASLAGHPSSKAASGITSQESRDVEAGMVNGHIQAF